MDPKTGEILLSYNKEDDSSDSEVNDLAIPDSSETDEKYFTCEVELATLKPNAAKQKESKKRKAIEHKNPVKKAKTEDTNTPIHDKFFAHKADLAVYDSLVKNYDINLWEREGNFMLQKFTRIGTTIAFKSTRRYRCWDTETKDDFLPIPVVMKKNTYPTVVEIVDITEIERACLQGDFKKLGLEQLISRSGKENHDTAEDMDVENVGAYLEIE